MARAAGAVRDLRERCVSEALSIIDEAGVEHLSLREVARRLGVSHQAPYKHFANRDALLAEVVAREYAAFAAHLDARPHRDDPREDLAELGRAYLGYAGSNPLAYRLMFGTPLPDPALHPEMMREGRYAFSILRDCIVRLRAAHAADVDGGDPDLDALFVWSLVHGMASIRETSAMATLGLSSDIMDAIEPHAGRRLMAGLGVAEE